jgi:hypothetical protein
MRVFAAALASIALVGCATYEVDENGIAIDENGEPIFEYYGWSVADLDRKLKVDRDPMEPTVTISSLGVRQWYRPLFDVKSNIFVRGFVPKSGADPFYQFYIQTQNDEWVWADRVQFGDPVIIVEANEILGASDVNCSASSCTHREDFYVNLEGAALAYFLKDDTPDQVPIRIKTRGAGDIDRLVNKNEVRAVVERGIGEQYDILNQE